MLERFTFQNTKLSVKLENFACQPEGGGLAATCLRQKGKEWFQSQRLSILLFGHRNTSVLNFEKGQLVSGASPLYGFSVFVDAVIEYFGTIDRQSLAIAIAAGSKQRNKLEAEKAKQHNGQYSVKTYRITSFDFSTFAWKDIPAIKALVTAKSPKLREQELEDLEDAITKAETFYWSKLKKWLDHDLPSTCDQVIISGGAAPFLLTKLTTYLTEDSEQPARLSHSQREGILRDGDLEPILTNVFQLNDTTLVARLADAYGLFDYLLSRA